MGTRWAILVLWVLLPACANPLEGRWEGNNELLCGLGNRDRVRFVVDDELVGRGGYCDCDLTFDADDRGGDVYRLDIDFDGVCFVADGKYDCDLERSGERLDCGSLGDFSFVGG